VRERERERERERAYIESSLHASHMHDHILCIMAN
jgi:hypothetical protein